MSDAKSDKPLAIADEEEPLEDVDEDVDEEGEEDECDDEDDEEAVPCVVVGRLADLRGFGDPAVLRKHAERPVWFMIQGDAEFVTLFDKHPEGRVAPALSRSIMDILRSFADVQSDALQLVLGPTDSLEFGFHERASLDDVVEAFEDDGFDVALVLRDGKVVEELEEED